MLVPSTPVSLSSTPTPGTAEVHSTPEITDPLTWAVGQFTGYRMLEYRLLRNYYHGFHPMAFATDKFRTTFGRMFSTLSDNLCAPVIDVQSERLQLTGFTTDKAKTETRTEGGRAVARVNDPFAEAAWNMWEDNYGDIIAREVHTEAMLMGDGYAIVWPDDMMVTRIWPQPADQMAVHYSSTTPDKVDLAAKCWVDEDDYCHINIYYPQHIAKYITKNRVFKLNGLRAGNFQLVGRVLNPYNEIPVFHFPNEACGKYGLSDLRDVMPLQDALNKAIADLLVAMEFTAYPQRWATGIEVELDEATGRPKDVPWRTGVDRMLTTGNESAKFGSFPESDLKAYLDVQNEFRSEIARVTGIPMHYFYIHTGDYPSGEALKTAELRFVKRLEYRQAVFGKTWEELIKFALSVDDQTGDPDQVVVPPDTDFNIKWAEVTPRSENEQLDVALKKDAVGVSTSMNLKELGYDDDEIAQMMEETASAAEAAAKLANPDQVPTVAPPPGPSSSSQSTPEKSSTGQFRKA